MISICGGVSLVFACFWRRKAKSDYKVISGFVSHFLLQDKVWRVFVAYVCVIQHYQFRSLRNIDSRVYL
jgi:hypothetical protein